MVPDHDERERLLDGANSRINGLGASLCQEIRWLVENSKHSAVMSMFLFQAIQEFATEAAKGDPDTFTKDTKGLVNGHHWVACANEVLAMRELRAKAFEHDERFDNPGVVFTTIIVMAWLVFAPWLILRKR
jgi:hypothetical protein